jgi:hypothetical protein
MMKFIFAFSVLLGSAAFASDAPWPPAADYVPGNPACPGGDAVMNAPCGYSVDALDAQSVGAHGGSLAHPTEHGPVKK